VAATRRIVRVTSAPVTADIEAGYGDALDAVSEHVEEIIGAGVVGINLEDGLHGAPSIREVDDASARIRAAREAAQRTGVPIVINARTDLYHLPEVDGQDRFAETLKRCRAYLEAGADCLYPFGLRDPDVISALTKAVHAPVNITGRPGMPSAAEFGRMGVARITIASAATLASMSAIHEFAQELCATGRFDVLASTMRHPDAQKLFAS
jgi:2-methylisocitrate lyase-like PEP mutase family enzyme